MSNLLSTTAMVAECQSRVPIGLSSSFWGKKLNEAYRWITQKGNFIWEIKLAPLTLSVSTISFSLPSDCNAGKPIYIYGPVGSTGGAPAIASSIPYVSYDDSFNQSVSELTVPAGAFSCWSMYFNTISGGYTGQFYPPSATPTLTTGDMSYVMSYHMDAASTEKAVSALDFFPTPNCFDSLLIELAEAEAKRIYGLAGWDIIQKRAESGIVSLLDPYRSTKNAVAGMVDQQKQTGERKLMGQENS